MARNVQHAPRTERSNILVKQNNGRFVMKALLNSPHYVKLLPEPGRPRRALLTMGGPFNAPDLEADWTFETIHARAEAVTPVLREILDVRHFLHQKTRSGFSD